MSNKLNNSIHIIEFKDENFTLKNTKTKPSLILGKSNTGPLEPVIDSKNNKRK